MMHIAEFQQWTKHADEASRWDVLPTLQLLSHLTEEVGELAQSVNRIYRHRAQETETDLSNLRVELVDLFWLLVKIANRFGVDLDLEAQGFVKRANERPAETVEKHHCELIASLMRLDRELTVAKGKLDLGQ